MSVVSALYSGISGITSNGDALAIAGDNIANISTPAFKASSAVFESALVQQIGNAQIGLGSKLAGTSANFSQGSLSNTTRPTDLAIQGSGFFVVNSSSGLSYYTRSGSFQKDSTGNLVTNSGNTLQAYSIDESNNVSGTLAGVTLGSTVVSSPSATTKVLFSLNLDAGATVPSSFDGTSFSQAAATSNFNVTTNVYDSLGNARTLVTYFRKEAANQYSYHVLTAGSNLTNYTGVSGGTAVLDDGLMTFDTSGNLTSVTGVGSAPNYSTLDVDGNIVAGELVNPALASPNNSIRWVGAATQSSITYDFGQVAGSTARTNQYAAAAATNLTSQNGRAQGTLQSIQVNGNGRIVGSFSNGVTRDIYKIPLAVFPNEEGLTRAGNNVYSASSASGTPVVADAQTAGRGDVRSFSIEQSNTDLAGEFVKIITYQRGFQASSRTVQVAAELLQDLVRLGQ
jgi:flagellar hook protein FlgE